MERCQEMQDQIRPIAVLTGLTNGDSNGLVLDVLGATDPCLVEQVHPFDNLRMSGSDDHQ